MLRRLGVKKILSRNEFCVMLMWVFHRTGLCRRFELGNQRRMRSVTGGMKPEIPDNDLNYPAERQPDPPPVTGSVAADASLPEDSQAGRSVWSRLYVAAGGTALLAVLAILYMVYVAPPAAPAPPIQTPVGLRKGFLPGRGGSEKVPDTAARGQVPANAQHGGRAFSRLLLQYQRPEARRVREFDLRRSAGEPFSLTAEDNYRLVLDVSAYRHVYVVQISPDLAPLMLFPNRKHSRMTNPVPPGRSLQLPGDPHWFHLGNTAGEERLLILAAETPFRKLEELWQHYLTAADAEEQQTCRHQLVELLQTLSSTSDIPLEIAEFTFRHAPPPDQH